MARQRLGPPGDDDPTLDPPPTSEEEERRRRARTKLAELVAWYVRHGIALSVELREWRPDVEGRQAWGDSLGAAKAAGSPADRMRQVANLLVSWGVRVQYASGWESRGRPYSFSPSAGVVDHHTASTSDIDSVLINGRSDLPGPLCHYAMHKGGEVVLIAAGYANHAGESVSGAPTNASGWGIEATGPIPAGASGPGAFPQYAQYQQLNAAILQVDGWGTSKMWGHKESCSPPGRKVDPMFDMDSFRAGTQAGAAPGEDDVPYRDWPIEDRAALIDDVARVIGEGKNARGETPAHLVDRSTKTIRQKQDLARFGDVEGGDFDPHDYTSNEGIFTKAKQVEAKIDDLTAKVDQLLAAGGGGGGTVPTFGGEHAH